MTPYDYIVVGTGAMGSAAAFHLARRGRKVLALERFNIPHDRGSSHGITRIIRLAYYEHPSYVPLLRRAYELWRELEQAWGAPLLHITGSLDAGPPASAVVRGSLESCRIHSLPHEVLTSAELARRFPGYKLPAEHLAVLQPDGGFLLPESCISAHVMQAQRHGAEIHALEPVIDWEAKQGRVIVRTERASYEAGRLIVTAGAWLAKLVPQLASLASPERQVLAWLQPRRPDLFVPERFPVFNLIVDEGRYYGFPVFGIPGFKVGRFHHFEQKVDPDTMDRQPNAEDERILREFVELYFPDGAGPVMSMHTCMFTNTPDEHFILDGLPGCPEVLVGSPCSGHGFKFSAVIGEILADLAESGATRHNISMHRLARFANRVTSSDN